MLTFVRGRIMIGVGAWLLGAGAATGGSMLAVSLIGQGMSGFASQPLTAAAVSSAARTDSDDPASTSTSTSAGASTTPTPPATATSPISGPPGPVTTSPATPRASARPSAAPGQSPSPAPASPAATAGSGTVLSSQGGDVVASCQAAGAYLISWSPQQGYETGDVRRGPAAQDRVTFESPANSVIMLVTCQGGVPQATSHVASGDDSTDE